MIEKLPISVVICVKNGEATIGRCLESVLANNPAEIIVIDGNSQDRTVEIARKYTDKIFSDEGRGLGYARQMGVKLSTQDFIAFLDADAYFRREDSLRIMLEELNQNRWDGINYCNMFYLLPSNHPKNFWGRAREFHSSVAGSAFNRLKMVTQGIPIPAAALSKRDCLMKLRFDPFFIYAAEYVDLGLRFFKAGYKLGISSVPIYHSPLEQLNFNGLVKHGIWLGKGDARLFWKHRSKSLRWIVYSILRFPGWMILCLWHKRPQYIPFFTIDWLSQGIGFISEIIVLLKLRIIKGE